VLFVLLLTAAFAVLAVAILALVGEWRAGRGFVRGEYVDDEQPLSHVMDGAVIPSDRTPGDLPIRGRVLVGAQR